jgi:16S rRNA (adenine1518-N6/adenine1519-N6)-dimethyltransferase
VTPSPGGPQGRAEIRALLERHGHHPNRSLGQNFLADPNIVDRIVRTAAVGPDDNVLEVGAGTGTLTVALAATGARVVAYEVDHHLGSLLAEVLEGTSVELRMADATAGDIGRDLGLGPWTMVANLPYNVGTPLVLDLLRTAPAITRFVVMVQSEVAERLAAGPGSRRYGLPSVIAALRAEVTLAFTVGPSVFIPRPEVESAVIEIRRRSEIPRNVDRAEWLASIAFGQRRKMLRRSLAGHIRDVEAALDVAGIDPTARPEMLAPGDFVRLAGAVG